MALFQNINVARIYQIIVVSIGSYWITKNETLDCKKDSGGSDFFFSLLRQDSAALSDFQSSHGRRLSKEISCVAFAFLPTRHSFSSSPNPPETVVDNPRFRILCFSFFFRSPINKSFLPQKEVGCRFHCGGVADYARPPSDLSGLIVCEKLARSMRLGGKRLLRLEGNVPRPFPVGIDECDAARANLAGCCSRFGIYRAKFSRGKKLIAYVGSVVRFPIPRDALKYSRQLTEMRKPDISARPRYMEFIVPK